MTITRVLTALALLTITTVVYALPEATKRSYKELCDEVRYELAQQVEEGLLEPSKADTINRRCNEFQEKETTHKRSWWE